MFLKPLATGQSALDQLASWRISDVTGWAAPATVGRVTGRRPISSAALILVFRQNSNELGREFSRMAMATAERKGRLSSTSTAANTYISRTCLKLLVATRTAAPI